MSSNPVSERRWWHGWSLRARLLAGQLLVLTLVCFVIGTGTLLSLNNSQMSQLDGQLNAANQRANLPPDFADSRARGQTPQGPGVCGAAASHPPNDQPFGFGQGIGTLSAVINNGVVQGPWELVDQSTSGTHSVCA